MSIRGRLGSFGFMLGQRLQAKSWPPIIDGADTAVPKAMPIIDMPLPQGAEPALCVSNVGPAPNAPMIGARRGLDYAENFADQLVRWVQAEGIALEWQVDDLVDVAGRVFAPTAGLEMPIIRNLLGALKRRSDVTVRQDRRVYDRHGRLIGKRSFYTIGTDGKGAALGDGGSRAPTPGRRAA